MGYPAMKHVYHYGTKTPLSIVQLTTSPKTNLSLPNGYTRRESETKRYLSFLSPLFSWKGGYESKISNSRFYRNLNALRNISIDFKGQSLSSNVHLVSSILPSNYSENTISNSVFVKKWDNSIFMVVYLNLRIARGALNHELWDS